MISFEPGSVATISEHSDIFPMSEVKLQCSDTFYDHRSRQTVEGWWVVPIDSMEEFFIEEKYLL